MAYQPALVTDGDVARRIWICRDRRCTKNAAAHRRDVALFFVLLASHGCHAVLASLEDLLNKHDVTEAQGPKKKPSRSRPSRSNSSPVMYLCICQDARSSQESADTAAVWFGCW